MNVPKVTGTPKHVAGAKVFSMEKRYFLDIPELDEQHQEIDDVVATLIDATGSHDTWNLVHYVLVHLHELLRVHFMVEESVMRIVSYPGILNHKETHRELLNKVEQLKNDALSGHGSIKIDVETRNGLLTHILDHDTQFAEFLKTYSKT